MITFTVESEITRMFWQTHNLGIWGSVSHAQGHFDIWTAGMQLSYSISRLLTYQAAVSLQHTMKTNLETF